MCTSISFRCRDHYFGRNLDLYCRYRESITITPRDYPFQFYNEGMKSRHYAIIGMAAITEDYPLYYDGANEHGLCAAGLNFPGNAVYLPDQEGKHNIASYELIPWVLCQCKDLKEARQLLEQTRVTDHAFSEALSPSPLHWMICDKTGAIVVEPCGNGLNIYDGPVGVLTNNPSFPYQMQKLNDYMSLSCNDPENTFGGDLELHRYSLGMGAIGLPGDLSSGSRFVRAAFTRANSVIPAVEEDCVGQFFHILDTVKQQKGCVRHGNQMQYTVYSCCINADKGIYYYTTYECRQVHAIILKNEDLQQSKLISYPLRRKENICYQN